MLFLGAVASQNTSFAASSGTSIVFTTPEAGASATQTVTQGKTNHNKFIVQKTRTDIFPLSKEIASLCQKCISFFSNLFKS